MGKTRNDIDRSWGTGSNMERINILANAIDEERNQRFFVGELVNEAIKHLGKCDIRLAALEHAQPQGNEDAVQILSTKYQRVLDERNEARKELAEAKGTLERIGDKCRDVEYNGHGGDRRLANRILDELEAKDD